jgi:glycosyltransferase involved in cell wall biosynthesis
MLNGHPAVSVGIPMFNAGRWIASTVRSVFAQTFDDWELILIDDGSSDSTLELVRAIQDPRVRVIADGANRGTAARYNEIGRLARAPYVVMLDHDDILHPDRFAAQRGAFDGASELDAVATSVYVIDEADRLIGARLRTHLETSLRGILANGLMCHSGMMARREWVLTNGYDESLKRLADTDLWCRTCATSKFVSLPDFLMYYRDITSLSARSYLTSYKEGMMLAARYGFDALGAAQTLPLIARGLAKSGLYAAMHVAGCSKAFRRLHNRPLESAWLPGAIEGLGRVLQQAVPGWPPIGEASPKPA